MKIKELRGIIGSLTLMLFVMLTWSMPAQASNYIKLDGSGKDLHVSAASWAMVRDAATGLIWEVKTNKDGIADYSNPNDADNTYTWYDSNPATNGGNPGTPGNGTDTGDFINALNKNRFGGYSDWRIPTIKELESILNDDVPHPGPTINITYFPNTQTSFYWSSNPYESHKLFAWGMNFGYEDVKCKSGRCKSGYVRAVRGGR